MNILPCYMFYKLLDKFKYNKLLQSLAELLLSKFNSEMISEIVSTLTKRSRAVKVKVYYAVSGEQDFLFLRYGRLCTQHS